MPNWGSNQTRIEGPDRDVESFFAAIMNNDGTITMVVNLVPESEGYGDFRTVEETDGNERYLSYDVPWGPLDDSTWEEISSLYPTLTFDTSYSEWDNFVMGRIVVKGGQVLAHVSVDPSEWPEEPEEPEDMVGPEYEAWSQAQQAYMDAVAELDYKVDVEVEEILRTLNLDNN